MESLTNALNAISDLHTKKICKDTLMQFMRGKGHTNVTFVRLTTKERMSWKNTKQLCMKERSPFNAILAELSFQEGIV